MLLLLNLQNLLLLCSFSMGYRSIVDSSSDFDAILQQGVIDRVYPAVVAMVGTADGKILYSGAKGNFEYSADSQIVTLDTIFDIASLSKVTATTTAVGWLYERGYLELDEKITTYLGDEFGSQGKENITVLNCLLHNAGFPPDPNPWYWDQAFGCPNTTPDESVQTAEDFSCLENIYTHLLKNQYLQSTPGEQYAYSDLSFITLQMVVGSIAYRRQLVTQENLRSECGIGMKSATGTLLTCYFEAFVRSRVFSHHGSGRNRDVLMPKTGYLIASNQYNECAPTLNDTGTGSYTHRRLQGQVSDGDCYAMGGFCGHAGVFSTVRDISRLLQALLETLVAGNDLNEYRGHSSFMLNATTLKTFTQIYNVSQSSRGLGWSTNNPNVKDYGFDQSCGTLSTETFMHTGYTGGCICVDPVNKVFSVILSNRVYNCQGQLCPAGSSDPVKAIYKSFNTALANTLINK